MSEQLPKQIQSASQPADRYVITTESRFEIFVRCGWAVFQTAVEQNKRTCEVNPTGENSSFIFTVCVKSVPLDRFKLAYVVLHMAVKGAFETHL